MRGLLPEIDIPLRVLLAAPLFFVFFVAMCLWVFRKRRASTYEKAARLPFDE